MKKNTLAALLGVTIALNLMLWWRTVTLEQTMQNLQQSMRNQIEHMTSEVRGISQSVSSALAREASIFDSYAVSFGEIEPEDMTIPLTVSVMPKEAGTATAATLTVNGVSVPMTRDGMKFTGVLSVGLFEYLDTYVTFDTEGVQRGQSLDTGLRPFEERLPILYVYNAGGSSFEYNANKFTFDGPIEINLKATSEDAAITSLKIFTTDNGVVIQEQALKPAFEPPMWSQMVDYKLTLTFEPNHTYETAVIATDSYGLTYRAIVDRQTVGESGQPTDFGGMDWWGQTIILDKDGRVLYDPMRG